MIAMHERRGATVVEFALVLPVLLLITFGSIELTRVSTLRHTANHAAYVAARDAIIPGANAAAVVASAEEHLAIIGIRDAVVIVDPSTITEDTTLVKVTVTFPVSSNSLVVPEFVSGSVMGQSAMITERSKGKMSTSLPEPPPPPPPPPDPEPDPEPDPDPDDDDDDDDSPPPPPPPPPPML